MTQEQILLAMVIIINNLEPEEAAKAIHFLWMDHPSYEVDKSKKKVVHKETKKDIILSYLEK